jgi:hypothetical protein
MLFDDLEAHRRTIELLKEKLDEIERQTGYKDSDYWHFHGAIEYFLYGDLDEDAQGVNWGITSFAPVWEDMCIVWVRRNQWDGVVYADSNRYANRTIGGHDLFVDATFEPPFDFELGGKRRSMRPDIVRSPTSMGPTVNTRIAFEISKHRQHPWIVKIKHEHRNELTKSILQQVRKKLERRVTHDSRSRKSDWSCAFFGIKEHGIWKAIDDVADATSVRNARTDWKVTDFKCVPENIYTSSTLGAKARRDERKQITYEYALQLSGVSQTQSQLCIPAYFADENSTDIGEPVDPGHLHSDLRDQHIEVFRVDFAKVLAVYLEAAAEEVEEAVLQAA